MAVALVAVSLFACSSGDESSDESQGDTGDEGTATTVRERPDGPAAAFGGPLEGGDGMFLATSGGGPDLGEAGYSEAEYSASGTATSYTSAEPLPADGTYSLEPAEEAGYSTRVVVRRPEDPESFNGTVVVEWLNVSSGADAAPDYTYLAAELLRGGYAWVGVSAQSIGIEGGEVAVSVPGAEGFGLGNGLVANDPERYGELNHPGDAFAYDIYSQVGRAVWERGAELDPLEGLEVERVLAIGESQSAFALTTYVNGVQPLAGVYDGFFIHSRGGAALPLGTAGAGVGIADAIAGQATTIRTDSEVPVFVIETETDLIGILSYLPARQDDSDTFRLWEVAGTAHADKYQVGDTEDMLDCSKPVNRGQQVFALRAALRHLDTWVQDGTAPPEGPRLEVDESGTAPALVLDDLGIATGGVRNPAVDAPVDILSGAADPDSSIVCILFGSTTPIDGATLAELYESPDDYVAKYEAATDAMIEAGFALEDDREEILDGADPSRLEG